MTPRPNIGGLVRRNPVLVRLLFVVAVLAGVYGGLALFLGGQLPANARVDGIAIGGMSPGEAKVTLKRLLADKAALPVHLTVPPHTVDIQPGPAGLGIDLDATLADLTGFTLNPVALWSHLTGKDDQPLRFRVDQDRLTVAVTKAARTLDSSVREGSITFKGGKVVVVQSVVGRQVKVSETTDAVVSAWPQRQLVPAITKMTQPKISAAEIKRAASRLALPAMSSPVKVLAGSPLAATIILAPRQYAPALSMAADASGRLQLRVDGAKLLSALRADAPDVEKAPVDATVRLVGGGPQVVPGVVGTRFDRASLTASFRAALVSSSRTAHVRLVPDSPEVTTAVAQGWRIKEVISTFTTQFPVNPPRTTNIKIAVEALNGTLVRPGDQFSLNGTLGQRTAEKGYQKAPVIYAGRLVEDYGGGVSQVSTTTFNAAFFAGVKFNQYTPHSFYIARYPEGREATVSWPDVDQKWTNDTGSGVLIKASVSGSDLTVTFLGTKKWDVQAVKGPRRNLVKPKNIVDAGPDCVPQAPTPGFDVTVTQFFRQSGALVKTLPFNTHYIPEDYVRCTKPAPQPAAPR